MYYVAFTRAMKSEYIVAYDTVVTPKIQADYEAILENLHDKAQGSQLQQADRGVTVVTAGEESTEDILEAIEETADAVADDKADNLPIAEIKTGALAIKAPAEIVKVDTTDDDNN